MAFFSSRNSYVHSEAGEPELCTPAVDVFPGQAEPQQMALEGVQRYFRPLALSFFDAQLQIALYAATE